MIAILGGLVIAAGATADSGFLAGTGAIVLIVALIIVPLAYFPWFWARDGSTPGMRMFGLRVVRDRDGGPISGGQAILRLIGYWIDGFVFYLGYIWILIDKRKRGWHDLIAGTVVVKTHRLGPATGWGEPHRPDCPPSTAILARGEVAERSIAAVLKTADTQVSVGSNPTLSASS